MAVVHHFYNFRVNTISDGSWQTRIQRLIKVKDKSFKGNKYRFIKNYHFSLFLHHSVFLMSILLWLKYVLFYEMLKPASWSVWAGVTIPQTRWFIKNRCLFLTVLEAGHPFWVPAWLGKSLPTSWTFDLLSYMGKGWGGTSGPTFVRPLIPLMKAPPSWANHSLKDTPPNTITLGIRFKHMNFGGTQMDTMARWKL